MDPSSFTLFDVIRRNAQLYRERPAFVAEGERVSHGAYLQRIEQLAAGLWAAGLRPGERLAVLAQNGIEFAELYGAAARLGAIVLPVNWRLGAEEIAYILRDGAPHVLVADAERQVLAVAAGQGVASIRMRYGIGGGAASDFQPFASLRATVGEAPAPAPGSEDGFVIIHTAATDGRPKGALLSHRTFVAANLQFAAAWHLGKEDVALGVLPLFHVAGLGLMLAVQQGGGTTVLLAKFDPRTACDAIAAEKVTLLTSFPPMLGGLLDAAAGTEALASLRAVSGLEAQETILRLEAACPKARFWVGYGQTETTGFATLAPNREQPGSAGQAAALASVAVVDAADRVLPAGKVGEIVVRGPSVFSGYWNRAAENAVVFRNGWHHTGDLGRFDEAGYLWYAGRSPAKELIKPGGENVYPAEVEQALTEHPAIAEACVIGVPDTEWGEAVKAICVLAPAQDVTAEALIAFVATRIARYKKPKHVVFADALPKAASGEIDRPAVKQRYGG
jgi:long-chain acyl-CoA synthetase